jgi:putative endonuclease
MYTNNRPTNHTLHPKHLGQQGERLVQRYFEQQGYQLLAANWRKHGIGELDLVLFHPSTAVVLMVEVKTRIRRSVGQESGLRAAFSPKKQARLEQLATLFLTLHPPTVANYTVQLLWVVVEGCADDTSTGATITCYPLTL